MSPQALEILSAIEKKEGVDLVFTTTGDTPVSGFSKSKTKLDEVMPEDTPPWRVHDLRRTAVSGMARLGVLPAIIERVLNHLSGVQGGLQGVYQRYDYLSERKQALDAWGKYVAEIVGPPVIPAQD